MADDTVRPANWDVLKAKLHDESPQSCRQLVRRYHEKLGENAPMFVSFVTHQFEIP